MTFREIAKIIPVSTATICRWNSNFVAEIQDSAHKMKKVKSRKTSAPSEKEDEYQSMQSEIARLTRELKYANLRADAYNELINVAEKKFKISIRKKAGTKQ